jgi:PAS domain-containing protein
VVHPDDVNAAWTNSASLRASTPFRAEYRLKLPDGRVLWVASHACTLCDAAGQPVRVIGTMADITGAQAAGSLSAPCPRCPETTSA